MVKARSPQYPSISLKEAVEKADAIYHADYQNYIPRLLVAQHMGYQGLNGKSLGVLASLVKFGLLEGRGDNTRVTDLAVRIIAHESGSVDRAEALTEAAKKPELFAEIDERFQNGRASDQAIRAFLLTRKFIPNAADAAIRSYRETKNFMATEAAPEIEAADPPPSVVVASGGRAVGRAIVSGQAAAAPAPMALPQASNDPFQITASPGNGLSVTAQLKTLEDVEGLVRYLNTWKVLLQPVGQAVKPEWADKTFRSGEFVPADGVYTIHHHGHIGEGQHEYSKGQRFMSCKDCVDGAVGYTQA